MPTVFAGSEITGWYLKNQVSGYENTTGFIESCNVEQSSKSTSKHSSEATHYATGTYLYQVDGQTYRGHRFELFPHNYGREPGGANAALLNNFPVGKEVTVHYDPQHQHGSYLQQGEQPSQSNALLIWSVIGTVVMLALVILVERDRILKFLSIMLFGFLGGIYLNASGHGLRFSSDETLAPEQNTIAVLTKISQTKHQTRQSLKVLKIGMTFDQVLQLIGRPTSITHDNNKLQLDYFSGTVRMMRSASDQEFTIR